MLGFIRHQVEVWLRLHWSVILLQLLIVMMITGLLLSLSIKKEELYIAFISSHDETDILSGNKYEKYQAISFYEDRLNKYGGIDGKKLVFLKYNDKGDIQRAKNIAKTIVAENKAVAVVSQNANHSVAATQAIYEAANIPVISSISQIDSTSNWLFQLKPSVDDYAIYVANYTKTILNKNKVTIVSSIDEPKARLIRAFKKEFVKLGGEIAIELDISGVGAVQTSRINRAISQINRTPNDDPNHFIFLATPAKLSAPFLVTFRRQNYHTQILSFNRDLANYFPVKDYPEEYRARGYFTENIYVASELLLDSVNRPSLALVKKDYDLHHPHKISYDDMSSILATTFITRILQRHSSILANNKQEIRNFLQEVLSEKSHWFNINNRGNASVLSMGIFKDNTLVTAPINLSPVSDSDIDNFNTLVKNNKLINIQNITLYPTPLVYAGVSMNHISDVKMSHKVSYYLDFYLWFRYTKSLEQADNVEFLNAVEPTTLYQALKNNKQEKDNIKESSENEELNDDRVYAELIKSITINGENYRRYRVKGYFQTVKPRNYALGQQNAYITFRHQQLNRYRLRFASDYTNSNQGVFALEENNINAGDIVNSAGLQLDYTLNYINFSEKIGLGSPEMFYESNEFSKFVAEYRLAPNIWSFQGILARMNLALSGHNEQIRMSLIICLLSILMAFFIFSIYAQHRRSLAHIATFLWLLQLPLIYLILVLGNFVLSQLLYNIILSNWGSQHTDEIELMILYMQYSVSILWWLVPAYYLTSAINHFIWRPVRHQTGSDIPLVLRLFVQAIIYGAAVLAIMSFVFNVTVTGLAATSGLLALIFALSSKIDLSNIMAGLGISLSKIFKLGDWVKIGDIEGQVVEMTPRSTRILTFNASIINIPNVTVASEIIENYNQPTPVFRLSINLELEAVYTVQRIEKILLAAVATTDEVLEEPQPSVIFKGQGESGQKFQLVFFISDYARQHYLWQSTWRQVWQHLTLAGIKMTMPMHEVLESNTMQASNAAKLAIIKNMGLLNHLSDQGIQHLADKLYSRYYQGDELIVAADECFNVLGIVVEGVISYKRLINQHWQEVDRIGAGNIFGATSLLDQTIIEGAVVAKTDSVVLLLSNVDFPILLEALAEVEPTHSPRYLSDAF